MEKQTCRIRYNLAVRSLHLSKTCLFLLMMMHNAVLCRLYVNIKMLTLILLICWAHPAYRWPNYYYHYYNYYHYHYYYYCYYYYYHHHMLFLQDWLCSPPPSHPMCPMCKKEQVLIVQLYCPLPQSAYHRTLYVFACSHCHKQPQW